MNIIDISGTRNVLYVTASKKKSGRFLAFSWFAGKDERYAGNRLCYSF